ncbi:hypothetical protein, partial [Hyalangium sp.]|uniref:hypothetical protein n=1 Tax=Hyalangium sp. TaxID=2028555 RepID=UPI002D638CBE
LAELGLDGLDLPAITADIPEVGELLAPVQTAADTLTERLTEAGSLLDPMTGVLGLGGGSLTMLSSSSDLTQLSGELDTSGESGALTGTLDGTPGDLGPLARLEALTPPQPDGRLGQATGQAGQVNTSGVTAAVGHIVSQLGPLVTQLPGAGDVVRPLETALQLVERVTAEDLPAQLRALVERLSNELKGPREGGFAQVLLRFADLLGGADELRSLFELARTVMGASGLDLSGARVVGDLVPAAVQTARSLGALMALESTLAEAERLTTLMQRQLDPAKVGRAVQAVEEAFGTGSSSLATFVAGIDVLQPSEVSAALEAMRAAVSRMGELEDLLAQSLGFGEATLVHMDLPRVEAEVASAQGLLRGVDTAPVTLAVQGLVDALRPVMQLELPTGPAAELDALLDLLEGKAQEMADAIAALDLSVITGPLQQGLGAVTGATGQLADVMTSVTSTARTTLEQVRQAVAAIPFEGIAAAIRQVLEPLNEVMELLGGAVGAVQGGLGSGAQAVRTALLEIEEAIKNFRDAVLDVLKDAEEFVVALDLDGKIGLVADNVNGFANTLSQAQLSPYFDTAVDVIGTAADVFSNIPFGMLPDDIKSEVDAAAAPIRAIDVEAVKTTVEGWFQITPEGEFALRGPLEDALADIQERYEQIVAAVEEADPRKLADEINIQLQRISAEIDRVLPQLNLQEVQDVIDQVKSRIQGLDVHAALAPIESGFNQVLAAVDAYSPAALITPLEERLDAARNKVVDEIKLDQWGPSLEALADQSKALVDRLDPLRLRPVLTDALAEANRLLDQAPDLHIGRGLGALLSSLLAGAGLRIHPWTFGAVLSWIAGESGAGALQGRAQRIADAVEATHASTQALDLQGLAIRLTQRAAALRAAIESLPVGSARTQLEALASTLQVDRRMAALASNRARYLGLLGTSAARTATLRVTGLSEVDQAIERLRATFSPLQEVREFLKRLLRPLGLRLDGSLKDAVRAVLLVFDAERVANIFTPIFTAARGRVTGLVDLLLTPMLQGITDLQTAIAAIDITPLREGLQAVYDEARGGIQALSPSALLGPTLTEFDTLKATLLAFDPLQPLRLVLDEIKAVKDRLVPLLDGHTLLASPITIYDEVMGALRALNLEELLGPVLNALDDLARQVDEGLDLTTDALERLQQALPAPGSGGGSDSISGSVG